MEKFTIFLAEKHEGKNRTKRSSMKELKSLLNEYTVEELRNILGSTDKSPKMYRGDKLTSKIGFINPKLSRRFSPYASNNFYNLYLSNHETWKEYPSREYSVVCSTDFNKAREYNNEIYMLIPMKRTAKIAIAPNDDIWTSFLTNVGDLNNLNREIANAKNVLERSGVKVSSKWDEDWNETEKIIKQYNKEFLEDPKTDQIMVTQIAAYLVQKYGSLYEALTILLSPSKNEFELKTFENFIKSNVSNKEVWTDEPCFMIKFSDSLEILHELTKEIK